MHAFVSVFVSPACKVFPVQLHGAVAVNTIKHFSKNPILMSLASPFLRACHAYESITCHKYWCMENLVGGMTMSEWRPETRACRVPEEAASLGADGGFILHTSFRSAGSVEKQADQKLDSTCSDAMLVLAGSLCGPQEGNGPIRGDRGLTVLCYSLKRQLRPAVKNNTLKPCSGPWQDELPHQHYWWQDELPHQQTLYHFLWFFSLSRAPLAFNGLGASRSIQPPNHYSGLISKLVHSSHTNTPTSNGSCQGNHDHFLIFCFFFLSFRLYICRRYFCRYFWRS